MGWKTYQPEPNQTQGSK